MLVLLVVKIAPLVNTLRLALVFAVLAAQDSFKLKTVGLPVLVALKVNLVGVRLCHFVLTVLLVLMLLV